MSRQRSASPATAICSQRREAREQMATMVHMGLHVFHPEWQVNKGGAGRIYSPSFRQITLKILGQAETLSFPVQTCTRVQDVRAALAKCLYLEQERIEFVVKQGCSTRKQRGHEEIASNAAVKGITSFRAQPHRWPHPIGIIGCGHGGMKALMTWLKDGNANVVAFERLPRCGGFCWLKAANKTSKLQSELGSYHAWWGEEFVKGSNGYPDANRWGIWPSKDVMLEQMQFAAESYGILPHVHFNSEVDAVQIHGRKTAPDRVYQMDVIKSSESSEKASCLFSGVWAFPGVMTRDRVVHYPGEDLFKGSLAYASSDACPYQAIPGRKAAVLGSGAFAVESARTCAEYGATKVFMVTRQKSLVCPRFASWFVHQAPLPTPARLVLKMFEPMYKIAALDDPWTYYSVTANATRTNANIVQRSRFGIGDVAFLMCYYGKLEFVEDTLKRLTENELHLSSGRKLEDIGVILKALGMLGDHKFDAVMKMKQVVGNFCDGDWRRPFDVDAKGLRGANLPTFSSGIIFKEFAACHKHLFDFPKIYYSAQEQGIEQALPVHEADLAEDQPAYAISIGHLMSSAMLLGSHCPETVPLNSSDEAYKHRMYHSSHGLERFLAACVEEWNGYQNQWRREGATQEFLPYPYTRELIEEYFGMYNSATGSLIRSSGVPEDAPPIEVPEAIAPPGQKPDWLNDDAAMSGMEMEVKADHKMWWITDASATMYDGFLRKERPHPTVPGATLPAPGWWQTPEERAAAAALAAAEAGEGGVEG